MPDAPIEYTSPMVGLVGPSRGSTRPKPPRPRARRAHRARVNARSRACTLASLPGTRARHRGSPTPTHPPDPAPPFRALSSVPTRAAAHPSADDRSARSLPYKGGEGAARRRRRRWRWQRRRRRRRRPRTAWLAQDCPLRELKRGPTTPPPQRWCDGTSSARPWSWCTNSGGGEPTPARHGI